MKKYPAPSKTKARVAEAEVAYQKTPGRLKPILTKDFTYREFKKIADKGPFTLANWADILHVSERTLHRYALDNSVFNGMQLERILLVENLIDTGNTLFDKAGFKKWLKFQPFSLQFQSPIELLNTYEGIREVINLLGRMQHGIPA